MKPVPCVWAHRERLVVGAERIPAGLGLEQREGRETRELLALMEDQRRLHARVGQEGEPSSVGAMLAETCAQPIETFVAPARRRGPPSIRRRSAAACALRRFARDGDFSLGDGRTDAEGDGHAAVADSGHDA